LSSSGYFSAALSLLAHRLHLPELRGSASIQLLLLTGWAQLYSSVGDYDKAHRILSRACELAHAKKLQSLILECKAFMAYGLLSRGAYDNAIALVDKALAEHGERSPFEARQTAKVFRLLARVRRGRSLERDERVLGRLIEFLRKKGMQWHLSMALLTRGEALLALQRGAEAEASLNEVIKVSERIRDRMLFWRCQYLLGRISEQGLRNERALRQYRRAAHTVREIAHDIEEERIRASFLGQVEVRDLLSRYERLGKEVGRKARHDVALLKRNELTSRKMLASLSAIGQRLTSILELDALLASILDLAIDNVRAERGVVYLMDEVTGTMSPASARGLDGEDLEDLSSFSRSVVERAAEGKTILTVDVGQDPTLSSIRSLIVHQVKSILCVPMRARGRVVGLIYLDTRKAQQLFTDKERTFIESFASQAAVAVENARLFGAMRAENTRLRQEVEGRFKELVGGSAAMRRLRDTIAGILETDCTVLVTGESGTGKELVARALHYNSPRHKGPFVPIDCGALPENLLEAELFGYCRGAFTGADRERVGLIESASGGTLFLDEITNTSLALQARLLRVLQEREVRRVGDNQPRKIDVRVVAATNADLQALMARNQFRQDLYYRLNVVAIEVPALRDRLEDIPGLTRHILDRSAGPDRPVKGLGPGVVELLCRHDWPGNIRELENVLERAAILSRGDLITVDALPEFLRSAWPGPRAVGRGASLSVGGDRRPADRGQRLVVGAHDQADASGAGRKTGEQTMIEEALRRFAGDKAKAARYIGWNRQKLYRRMKSFRIPANFGKAA
jgi:Nif-specific regulatory protein